MKQKNLHVKITTAESAGKWVMGAIAKDRDNDTISGEAFTNAISATGGNLITLWQHQSDKPIGYWHKLEYKAGQLIGELKLSAVNLAGMVKQLLDDGVPLGASIGFRGLDGEYNEFGGVHFTEIELLETSIVSVPAQPLAQQIAKNYGVSLDGLSVSRDTTRATSSAQKPPKLLARETLAKAARALEKR
jgi:HK97 family phage prohead protease